MFKIPYKMNDFNATDQNYGFEYFLNSTASDAVIEAGTDLAAASDNGDERNEELAKIEILILIVIFNVTLIGNLIVLLALSARKRYSGHRKLTRMFFFILHLSLADLISAFLNVLPQMIWKITFRFKGGAALCKLIKFGQPLGNYLSSYILLATAVDRYQAICFPLTYCTWTSKRAKYMVTIAWLISLSFCLPQLFIFSYQEISPNVHDCWATFPSHFIEQAYVTWYGVSVFFIPLIVLVFTYTFICTVIWRSANHGFLVPNVSSPPSTPRKRCSPIISRAKINTIKQTIIVIILYIASSTPFIVSQLWATWDPNAHKSPFWSGATFTILALLSSLNSCVNPWVYLCFNRDLVKFLGKMLHKEKPTNNVYFGESSSSQAAITSSSLPSNWNGRNSTRRVAFRTRVKIETDESNCIDFHKTNHNRYGRPL